MSPRMQAPMSATLVDCYTDLDLAFWQRANTSFVEWEDWLLAEESPRWLGLCLQPPADEQHLPSDEEMTPQEQILREAASTKVPSTSSDTASDDDGRFALNLPTAADFSSIASALGGISLEGHEEPK